MSASSLPNIDAVKTVIVDAAREVGLGQVLVRDSSTKDDGSMVTETDRRMQEQLFAALRSRWPQFAVMGEEMEYRSQSEVVTADGKGFWTLDPLDGTTNFAMGYPFYGVSLALVIEGEACLGVVYDPIRNELFSAIVNGGAFLNDRPLHTPDTGLMLRQCIANVDYKRLVAHLAERLVRYPPYRSQRNLGSSVLEWCWLAAGRVQLYLHGGQRMWDYAAGSLILREAGGVFTTLEGLPFDCRKITKRSVVAAVNSELHHSWLQWIWQNDERRKNSNVTL